MRSTTMLPDGVIVPMALRCARYHVRGSVSAILSHRLVVLSVPTGDSKCSMAHAAPRPAPLVVPPDHHQWLAIEHQHDRLRCDAAIGRHLSRRPPRSDPSPDASAGCPPMPP